MNAYTSILTCLLLSLASVSAEPSEMERRLQEQERQIARLETENSQLRWLIHRRGIKIEDPSLKRPDDNVAPSTHSPSYLTHLVQKGESLSQIARKNGTSPEALAALNGIRNPSLIRAGQSVRLPETKQSSPSSSRLPTQAVQTHIVAPGETLYRISINHGMKLDQLLHENPGVDPHALQIGQKLRVIPPIEQATDATSEPMPPLS